MPGKVNAEEAVSLAESGREGAGAESEGMSVWMEDKLARAAVELFERHGDHLPWIAVTNGGLPAYLFSREFLEKDSSLSSFWRWGRCAWCTLARVIWKGRRGAFTFSSP